MSFLPLFSYTSALLAFGIAVVALFREKGTSGRIVFALGLILLAAEVALAPPSFLADDKQTALFWKQWGYLVNCLVPFTWLFFSLQFSRGNRSVFVKRWIVPLALSLGIPLGAAFLFPQAFSSETVFVDNSWEFHLGLAGYVVCLVHLAVAAFVLINLERTFRAAVGTYRWRIKFLTFGVALLFVARVYTESQTLLLNRWEISIEIVRAAALFCAVLLFARGLFRAGVFQVQVYPSERVLQYSVVAFFLGAYLLILGLFSKVAEPWAGAEALTIKALVLLFSLVAVVLLLSSDRARDSLHRRISRHFQRPLHDYRSIWLAYTEKTAVAINPADLSRLVANWLSETLRVLSVTIWLADDEGRRLQLAASTCHSDPNSDVTGFNDEECANIISALQGCTFPFDIDAESHAAAAKLRASFPSYFRHGGNRVCVPLHANGRLLGIITLGDRVNSIPLVHQDLELLKCIADQFASNLLNISLSQRLLESKEMEAFQTIAAFFVHDLKNTASTLNLTLQNLPKHWENATFRQDALRAISRSVEHINDLIKRLTLFRQKLEIHPVPTDLNGIIESAIRSLGDTSGISTHLKKLQKVSADPDQLHKVFTNLLLNAREASSKPEIRVQTTEENGWIIASVADNGCGMSAEFVSRNLFRPFQSTKNGGIGIGMFQTRAIVEAHSGRIEVETRLNHGTTFKVFLPLPSTNVSRPPQNVSQRDLLAA